MEFKSPFEKPLVHNENNEETLAIYRKRAFESVEESIKLLKQIESGEISKLELSEDERAEVLEFENSLGEKLENIYGIKVRTLDIYPEYFLTNIGRAAFRSCNGFILKQKMSKLSKSFYTESVGCWRQLMEN
jgi:hypothetical protein